MKKCYVQGCCHLEEHFLRVDSGIVLGVCDNHYDDVNPILNECADDILKLRRDAMKKIRHLSLWEAVE